jgi:hypothetical protein
VIKFLTTEEVQILLTTATVLAWASGAPPDELVTAYENPKWLEAAWDCLNDMTRLAEQAGR